MVTLSHPEPSSPEPLCIDCDDCALQDTEACRDCIVTFLCGVDASQPVVVDLAEARALRVLGEAGLAPPILFSRRPDTSPHPLDSSPHPLDSSSHPPHLTSLGSQGRFG